MNDLPVKLLQSQTGAKRCICHRLLCCITGSVVELKCAKCKRMLRIFTNGIIRMEIADNDNSRSTR